MARPRVYVAGPISKGDRYENIHQAIRVGRYMVRDGLAPMVPHLDHYMFPHPDDLPWQTALDWDLAWVEVAEAVFRLPGPFKGADLEVHTAESLGIPVFTVYADLIRWAERKEHQCS